MRKGRVVTARLGPPGCYDAAETIGGSGFEVMQPVRHLNCQQAIRNAAASRSAGEDKIVDVAKSVGDERGVREGEDGG